MLDALGNKFLGCLKRGDTGAIILMQFIEETTAGITPRFESRQVMAENDVSLPGIVFIVIFIVALLSKNDLDGPKNKNKRSYTGKWRAKLSDFRDNVLKSVVVI